MKKWKREREREKKKKIEIGERERNGALSSETQTLLGKSWKDAIQVLSALQYLYLSQNKFFHKIIAKILWAMYIYW